MHTVAQRGLEAPRGKREICVSNFSFDSGYINLFTILDLLLLGLFIVSLEIFDPSNFAPGAVALWLPRYATDSTPSSVIIYASVDLSVCLSLSCFFNPLTLPLKPPPPSAFLCLLVSWFFLLN